MSTTSTSETNSEYVTFCTLRTTDPETGRELAETAAREVRDSISDSEGFRSALVHISTDDTTVVILTGWSGAADHRRIILESPEAEKLRTLADRPGVVSAESFSGVPAPGIHGPDSDKEPGIVVLATRQVGGHDNANALADLLVRSGEWKRHFPGFVGATPYISVDGETYINYPGWVDDEACDAYLADPRNAAGQPDIAALEVSEPKFLWCTVFRRISGRKKGDREPA
ncbi:Antibiotic biosynthesis monooxygenase [Actinopolyspora mzabensis]|uniref:Antibiotic biosynthesis monooxygenase n=1 Tax=Actinopolyspora mzabensis TaxID=995066 RepID=A0A1G8ZCU4_ACTMZ|nr:antibiotic biosynthesis monooxygenase [Actinopolyspora mzabensis]SDK12225.1 Antibiotic biosynthesis monooxygenase [Actinopolyspora mzabensis]